MCRPPAGFMEGAIYLVQIMIYVGTQQNHRPARGLVLLQDSGWPWNPHHLWQITRFVNCFDRLLDFKKNKKMLVMWLVTSTGWKFVSFPYPYILHKFNVFQLLVVIPMKWLVLSPIQYLFISTIHLTHHYCVATKILIRHRGGGGEGGGGCHLCF